jgi:hypothetical protein
MQSKDEDLSLQIHNMNGAVLFVDKPEQGGKIKFTANGNWEEIEF